MTAEHGQTRDDVIAGLHVLNERANFFDNAGRFVAKNAGRWERIEPIDKVEVTVANAAADRFDNNLVRAGLSISTSSTVRFCWGPWKMAAFIRYLLL